MERRDFLKLLGLFGGSAALAGCAPELSRYVSELPPTINPDTPTPLPFRPQTKESTPAVTDQPEAQATVEPIKQFDPMERFRFGKWDFSKPFMMIIPLETGSVAGYGEEKHINEDIPLPTIEKDWTAQQVMIMNSSAEDNSGGNPFVVASTDRANMIIIAAHSYQSTSFEAIRGLAAHEDKWPALLGKPIALVTGEGSVTGEIASIQKIPAGLFMDGTATDYSWGQYDNDPNGALFGRTDIMGFPEAIRKDSTPGVFYLALATCISEDGRVYTKGIGWKKNQPVIVLDLGKDTAMRAIVILKFHE